jgi:ERCC4-type nuclease
MVAGGYPMIFVDNREPLLTQNLAKSQLGEHVQVTELPWADYWITPWASAPEFDLPHNIGELLIILGALNVDAQEFIESAGGDLAAITNNTREVFANWLAKRCLLIESKTPSDFFNTWKSQRLDAQALHMADHGMYAMYLLKGYIYPSADDNEVKINGGQGSVGWPYWAFAMKMVSLSLRGTPVLMTTEPRFMGFIQHLAKWFRSPSDMVRAPKPHSMIPLEPTAEFLCGLPGIGPKTATNLIAWAGSPSRALWALTSPATASMKDKPEGVGPVTIKNVRNFLGLHPAEIMLPVVPDDDEKKDTFAAPGPSGSDLGVPY